MSQSDGENTISTKQLVQWLGAALLLLASGGVTLWIRSVSSQIDTLQQAFTTQHASDGQNLTKLNDALNTGLNDLRKQYYEQALSRQDSLAELRVQVNDLKRQLELVNDRLGDIKQKKDDR